MNFELPQTPNSGSEAGEDTAEAVIRGNERGLDENAETGPVSMEEIDRLERRIRLHKWGFGLMSASVLAAWGVETLMVPDPALEARWNKVNAEQKGRIDQLTAELSNFIPSSAMERIKMADFAAFVERASGDGKTFSVNFEGFESKTGLNNVTNLWVEGTTGYPKGFINGSVDEIIKCDSRLGINADEYGKILADSGTAAASAGTGITWGGLKQQVKFYHTPAFEGGRLGYKIAAYDRVFGHEIMHLNAPDSDRSMNLTERLELLKKIVDRLNSSDRFDSDYVESIELKDKKNEMDVKATEYWAEIGMWFFHNPTMMMEKHPKDYALVYSVVEKKDAGYDPRDRHQARTDFIKKLDPNWTW